MFQKIVLQMDLTRPSNAPLCDGEVETFQVTHPFHPLKGKQYALITYRHNWGEDLVYYHDKRGRLCRIPASWTNVIPPDPFVALAGRRSPFRISDLLELSRLIDALILEKHKKKSRPHKKGV